MPTEPEHPRATTATIDRRVERLEVAHNELDRKVDQLSAQVEYMNKLLELRFSAIEAAIAASSTKLDAFIAKIEVLISEGQKAAADLRAAPLGRALDDRIVKMEAKLDSHESSLDELRGVSGAVRSFLFPALSIVISIATLVFALSQNGVLP